MIRILVINGPNINLLGKREPDTYGEKDYNALIEYIHVWGAKLGIDVETFQSNHEGEIIDCIQRTIDQFDGIVINPAAYSHTSIAILDALKAVAIPTVEVHLTDISTRENYRRHSYISEYAIKVIMGHGFDGYHEAMEYLIEYINESLNQIF